MKTLSIRQPWAWLICNGWKDIENRNWATKYRGRFLVHASKGCTQSEYEDAKSLVTNIERETGQVIPLPALQDLDRGGIVGVVELTDCVAESDSPWFFGDYGFTLANAAPLAFLPLTGRLGFFNADHPEAP